MFAIVAHQRTGTHLLASLLNSHPELRCYDEIFLEPASRPVLLGRKKLERLEENEGFILMYTQYLKYRNRLKVLQDKKIIHLTRENIEEHTKSLNRKNVTNPAGKTPEQIGELIKKSKTAVFDHAGFTNVFEITYEQICKNNNISEYRNDDLCNFLNIEPVVFTTEFRKGVHP